MTEGVVDALEAVEIERQNRQPLAFAFGACHRVLELAKKTLAVRQTGEAVVVGQPVNLFLGPPTLRDVLEGAALAHYLAARPRPVGAKAAVHLVGPACVVVFRVPVPAADLGQLLCLGEVALPFDDLAHLVFEAAPVALHLGTVAREVAVHAFQRAQQMTDVARTLELDVRHVATRCDWRPIRQGSIVATGRGSCVRRSRPSAAAATPRPR